MSIRNDFPIFENNPGMIFFDSTSTTQKPRYVTNGIKEYLENSYSNIHRGAYDIAETSENLYVQSKKKVAQFIGAESWREVIYTSNSTYAANILTTSLSASKLVQKDDVILLSIVEHHANIVPWQILAKNTGAKLEYIAIKDDYSLDMEDFSQKMKNPRIKIVSLTHVSNVTGEIFPVQEISDALKQHENSPLYFIDASQSVPHFPVDVQKLNCDALFFTGHKVLADSGIGVLYGKKGFLNTLSPSMSGGGAISWVKEDDFKPASLPDKFEPGTPNMSGAVSLLRALEYIDSIGGYEKIHEIEADLVSYMLEQFQKRKNIELIGGINSKSRVGVFSFAVKGIHSNDIAELLAEENICIRAGQHCAEPLMIQKGLAGSCRASLYIYNTKEEIDTFFKALDGCIEELYLPVLI